MSTRFRRRTAAAWSRFLVVLLSVVGLSLSAGCSKSIESPELKASTGPGSVTPDLVCTGQMTTNVVIKGSGFAPIPTKTLEGPNTELVLPTIELVPVSSLDPMAPATATQIPDDPANPSASKVHYLSDTQMSFDIDESLKLQGGVYDIVATNPDGTHSDRWPAAIALIPPPEITDLVPPAVCDDQTDQTITLNGRFFLKVDGETPTVTINGQPFEVTMMGGCTPLQANIAEKVEICASITITIPVMSLGPGEFDIVVMNPGTANCESKSEVKVKVSPPPRVDSVLPQNVCAGGSLLTITGQNFGTGPNGEMPKVELRFMDQAPIVATAVTMSQPGTELKATLGPGPVAGTAYDVVVINPDGCEDRPLPHKQVTGVEGPILFFVDPPVVSNAINTRVTLFATVINKPLPMDAVSITPAGQMMPVTVLDHNDVVGFPKRLQAVVPAGLPPGSYDVHLKDASDCSAAILPGGLTVAADQNLTILRVEPPFGDSTGSVPITIFRNTAAPAPGDAAFVATPSVFLNPAASQSPPPGAVGIEVSFVTLVDKDTLTAVVPANTPPGLYDVVIVNPDGNVGIYKDGYTSLESPPPVVEVVTPPSVASALGQMVVLEGDDFRADAVVSLMCVDAIGVPTAAPAVTQTQPTCDAMGKSCSMTATIDASGLGAGSVCVLRVTNADASFGDFSAIGVTTPALNLETPKAGTPMNVARRGLVSAAAKATSAARFVFAVGGDDGAAMPMVFSSVEAAPVDLFGKMGSWALQRYSMATPRVFAGGASAGRYIYVGGGSDGTNDLASVERALLLSPAETPVIADVDLALGDVGLDSGQWFYRVSAVFDAADPENPGGESLASDEFVIKLPAIPNKKIAVILNWTEPKDALGVPLPNVAGYRVYRTPVVNGVSFGEVLLAEVTGGATLKYTDDGSATPGTEMPLPLGSTGAWAKLPDLAAPRSGTSFAIGADPDDPDKKLYLYALHGKNGAALHADYEYLAIDVGVNGRHSIAGSWTTGMATGTGRWNHGTWIVDRAIKAEVGQMPNDLDTTFIYVGGGRNVMGGFIQDVDRARIQAGGELDAFAPSGKDLTGGWAGFGVLAAAGQLFVFGGDQGLPSTKGISGQIVDGTGQLANNSWNAGLALSTPRAFMGSSVQSAFAFFIGGATSLEQASTSTELVVW